MSDRITEALERKYWENQLEHGETPELRALAAIKLGIDITGEEDRKAKKKIEADGLLYTNLLFKLCGITIDD